MWSDRFAGAAERVDERVVADQRRRRADPDREAAQPDEHQHEREEGDGGAHALFDPLARRAFGALERDEPDQDRREHAGLLREQGSHHEGADREEARAGRAALAVALGVDPGRQQREQGDQQLGPRGRPGHHLPVHRVDGEERARRERRAASGAEPRQQQHQYRTDPSVQQRVGGSVDPGDRSGERRLEGEGRVHQRSVVGRVRKTGRRPDVGGEEAGQVGEAAELVVLADLVEVVVDEVAAQARREDADAEQRHGQRSAASEGSGRRHPRLDPPEKERGEVAVPCDLTPQLGSAGSPGQTSGLGGSCGAGRPDRRP